MKTGLRIQQKVAPRPSFTPVPDGLLQRAASQPSSYPHPSEVPPLVHEVLRSPGQPLDAETRAFMEPRFSHDFGRVRVHANSHAAASAEAVEASAYTVGGNIVFDTGQYAPQTEKGRRLLAHELTHVVQQSGIVDQARSQLEVSSPTDPLEQEAETISQAITANRREMHGKGDSVDPVHDELALSGLSQQFLGTHSIQPKPRIPAVPLRITSARTYGIPRLARAVYKVGELTIEIDYGDIASIPASNRESAIETRFTNWTGSLATTIHSALTALTPEQQKWILFGLDVLVDNTKAAHGSFNRIQGVQQLIAHAPSAATQPLGAGSFPDFPNEVLRVSGWFETALSARLTAPTGPTLTSISTLYNPPPGPSASAGGALDVARLNADIPPALTARLQANDPANWASTGTDPIGGIKTIGDQIQTEARKLFAPYGDTASANAYARGWVYSAHITSTVTMVPTLDQRISYLLNRAERTGRSQPAGAIFANCNYDSSRPEDRAALLAIVSTMEADPVIQSLVNRLLQHTGQTQHPAGGTEVGIPTEFDLSSATECAARWDTIDTLTHELLHAMVHPKFPAAESSIRFGQIVREGFTSVLGVQLYESVRSKAAKDPAFKGQMEAGIAAASCPAPPGAVIGYGQAGANAESIRTLVGNDNFRAAYFLGALNLVGL